MAEPSSTEALLTEWGKWIRMGKPGPVGAKSWLGAMRDRLIQQSRSDGLVVPDSTCERFNQIVMLPIKRQSPKSFEALRIYYSDQEMTVAKMAKMMRVRKQTAGDLLNLGKSLAEGLTMGTDWCI